ncbi:MAG: hypothetical protein HC927_13420, partial [Deltaproteobacteria bacterium]|nr:hypothetical protein [Deltaproteobacteria bacterium]
TRSRIGWSKAAPPSRSCPDEHAQVGAGRAGALEGTNFQRPEQEFRVGLVHGTYRIMDNSADMHVDRATQEHPHLTVAMIKEVLEDVYQAMAANYAQTESPGMLDWRPTGAAVVKMVVELLGSALGSGLGVIAAKGKQLLRKNRRNRAQARDPDVLSSDIIPEHIGFLGAMQGKAGVSVKAALPADNRKLAAYLQEHPNATEAEQRTYANEVAEQMEQNMLSSSDAGKARLAEYKQSLEAEQPASLRIVLDHTHLPALIRALDSL